MALNHVAQRASCFVKTAAPLHTESFGRGNLDVIYIIPVPKRLKNSIAKAENQKILDRIFSQVMIDTVDLLLVEHVEDDFVQFLRAR